MLGLACATRVKRCDSIGVLALLGIRATQDPIDAWITGIHIARPVVQFEWASSNLPACTWAIARSVRTGLASSKLSEGRVKARWPAGTPPRTSRNEARSRRAAAISFFVGERNGVGIAGIASGRRQRRCARIIPSAACRSPLHLCAWKGWRFALIQTGCPAHKQIARQQRAGMCGLAEGARSSNFSGLYFMKTEPILEHLPRYCALSGNGLCTRSGPDASLQEKTAEPEQALPPFRVERFVS